MPLYSLLVYHIFMHVKLFPFRFFQAEIVVSFSVFAVPEDCPVLFQLEVQKRSKSLGWKYLRRHHPICYS